MNAKLEHAISKTLSDISESTYMNEDEDRVEMNVRVRGYFKGLNLVEAPAKVVVSEEEAKMLEEAKKNGYPADVIDAYNDMRPDEDRLMRAYVNGWVVEKPKHYVLPMKGTEYHNAQMRGNAQYYAVKTDTNWRPDAIALGTDDAVEHGYTVTQANIDAAPDWVKAIKAVEVTDDEQ